jgi:hypothetical protein
VLGVDGEIVVERRRQWTPEAKAALMAEVEAEGGQVSVVHLFEGEPFFPDCADATHAAHSRELRPFRADLRRS